MVREPAAGVAAEWGEFEGGSGGVGTAVPLKLGADHRSLIQLLIV